MFEFPFSGFLGTVLQAGIVYPNEIEDVVYSHKDIFECAVVGVKDAKSGETVKLYLASTNPDLSVDDIKAYCRERLTGYKIPKFIDNFFLNLINT